MGNFRVRAEVANPGGDRFEALEALVGIGATYTLIPRDVLERFGVRSDEERPSVLANGRQVPYPIAWIRVRIEGRTQPTIVVFEDPGTGPSSGPSRWRSSASPPTPPAGGSCPSRRS